MKRLSSVQQKTNQNAEERQKEKIKPTGNKANLSLQISEITIIHII